MANNLEIAAFKGSFCFGEGLKIPCYVLGSERIIRKDSLILFLGDVYSFLMSPNPPADCSERDKVRHKLFVQSFPKDLIKKLYGPIRFSCLSDTLSMSDPKKSQEEGYNVSILMEVCDAVFAMRDQGSILKKDPLVKRCNALMRSLAGVGVCALVDEVTQNVGGRESLERIFERTFRGMTGDDFTLNRLALSIHCLKDSPFSLEDPLFLTEIRSWTKAEMLLREKSGADYPSFLASLGALVRVSDSWGDFLDHLDKAFPSE